MKNNKKELDEFKNNMWKTRKARINASERLNATASFIKFLNAYYSCFIIVINLIDISNNNYHFEIMLLALSIILTISIFFFDSQQYLERSNKIKNCYIDIQKIYFEINEKNLLEKRNEYYDILRNNENHTEYDYYKVIIKEKEATLKEYLKYYLYIICMFLLKALFIVLPMLFLGYIII